MNLLNAFVLVLGLTGSVLGLAEPLKLSGTSAVDGGLAQIKPGKKGNVLVFLSARCPCSASHIDVLRKMSKEFPDYQFVGVHSNSDEGKDLTRAYFKNAELGFPVLQDTGGRLANQYRALKTPHVFVVQNDGKTVYRGGVTESRNCEPGARNYLREALEDLTQGKEVRTADARTLGCAITRGGKNDW